MHNWNLRLIGLDEKHSFAAQLEFNGKHHVTLSRAQLACSRAFPKVVAVVAYDEPTEQVAAVRAVHADGERRRAARRRGGDALSRVTP